MDREVLMAGLNFDREEILRTWQIFRRPGEVLEMRIPKAGKYRTISGYFDNAEDLLNSVIGLADQGFPGIYFTINPVKPDLLARAANRHKGKADSTTRDREIIALHWLPIDFDAKRPSGVSSTEKEHDSAISKAREVRQWLIEQLGWPEGAFVLADSGNGGHICVRIDLPNSPEGANLVEQCLRALDYMFSDDVVHIDVTTKNPARIWKLYGTMARKGDSTLERHHRMARILEAQAELATVSREQLESLASKLHATVHVGVGTMAKNISSAFDPRQYAESHGAHVTSVKDWIDKSDGKWKLAILEVCPFDSSHNRGEARIGLRQDGARSFRCFHNSCKDKDWHALKALWSDTSDEAARQISKHSDSEELTEGGNAQRLERIHGGDMRYNHTQKRWLIWDSGRWKIDANGGAMRLAGDVVGALYLEAANASDRNEREKLANFAKATDTRRGLTNMLALAANRSRFALTADDFDCDPWLLGAEDVTIDLKAGKTRQPQREDLITKAIGTIHDGAAKCPQWITFLNRIFSEDKDLIAYMKRAFGYCLTGSMVEQIFFFCYGTGSNGKSVLLDILRELLGEYARQADFGSFLVQRNEKVRNDLAALAGARVITAIEVEEGGRLSMQVIKAWTGGDPITARFLFGENFTFKPTGKIWLAANNKPTISEHNHAAWRRVRLIPFNVTISEGERDNNLEAKLLQELPGILNWALEGLQDYLQKGMQTPKAVLDATNNYRRENDSLELFISECCEVSSLRVCKNSDMYDQYINFCGMSGLNSMSQKKFSLEMKSRPGINGQRNKHGMAWIGIDLKEDWKRCMVEANPISEARDAKGAGLSQNAQSIKKFPLRDDFTQNNAYPTQHSDSNPTPRSIKDGEDGAEMGKDGINCKNKLIDSNAPGQRNAASPDKSLKKASDSGLGQFKALMAKRRCCLCGRTFPYDLTSYFNDGVHGFICTTCHMGGAPSEPAKGNTQTALVAKVAKGPGGSG